MILKDGAHYTRNIDTGALCPIPFFIKDQEVILKMVKEGKLSIVRADQKKDDLIIVPEDEHEAVFRMATKNFDMASARRAREANSAYSFADAPPKATAKPEKETVAA